MKRYKELKYNHKVFSEQYKIDEILIKEGFQWFLDCEVEEVRLEISHKTLIFNSGTFFNGNWKYGVFRDGVWKYGTWEDGVWYNGKWYNGIFKSGLIFDGKFFHGKIEDGEIKGGEFYDIEIDNGVKRQQQKKEEPVDNTTPQGEKISGKHMKTRNIKSFSEFTKMNENTEHDSTKDEIWKRLMEIDELLNTMDKDSEESVKLSGEYDELSTKLDSLESFEDDDSGKSDDIEISKDDFETDPSGKPLDDEEIDTRGILPSDDDFETNPSSKPLDDEIDPEEKAFSIGPIVRERPVSTPQDREEEWKRLSSGEDPTHRRIFKTMDDFLSHQGKNPNKYMLDPDRKVKKGGGGTKRKI